METNKPFFSIIIPTRERHQTLHHAMRTILSQSFTDFELVIMDNCSSAATAAVAQSFQDRRIKYFRSEQRLSMTENWEMALSKALGQYVTVMGDDDGMVPNALSNCKKLIASYAPEIISWYRWPYFWPNAPQQQNSLYVSFDNQVSWVDSYGLLKGAYQYLISYEHLPMLYNSFVSRHFIDDIKHKNDGLYYSPNCFCPDVFSGAVNAFFCKSFIKSGQPFTLSGISGSSNLSATTNARSRAAQYWRSEESAKVLHPILKLPHNADRTNSIIIASDFLWAKQTYFPFELSIEVNLAGAIQNNILNRLNDDPQKYDYLLNLAQYMIQALNLPPELFQFPPQASQVPTLENQSCWMGDPSHPTGIVLNCRNLGIENIFDAVNLLSKIVTGKISIMNINSRPHVDPSKVSEILSKKARASSLSQGVVDPDVDSRDDILPILEARYHQAVQLNQFLETRLATASSASADEKDIFLLQKELVELAVSQGLFSIFDEIFELLRKSNHFTAVQSFPELGSEEYNFKLAFLAWVCRDYDTALNQAFQGISRNPANGNCYWISSLSYLTSQKHLDAFFLASSGVLNASDPRLHSCLELAKRLVSKDTIANVSAWDSTFKFHLTAFNGQALDASIRYLDGVFCESDELDYIQNYFSDKPPVQGIVEVGSLVGSHSCFYLKKLRPKQLYIFDASSQSVKYTTLNLALNQSPGDKTLYSISHKAVGDSEKNAQFFGESVQQVSLDSETFYTKVDFMKIDVDGGEISVVNGAKSLIQRDRPHIFVEVQDINLKSLIVFLQENSYRIEKVFERPNELNLMLSPDL